MDTPTEKNVKPVEGKKPATPSTELSQAPKRILTIRDQLESPKFRDEIAKALPKHLTPDRFIRVAVSTLTRTPKLKECEPVSLFGAMLTLSQLGIEPDGRRAHLIPFENRRRGCVECQLIIDYKGLAEMAMRSGVVSYLHADVVCDADIFEENMGEIVAHKIDRRKPRGEVYAAYAICKFKDGTAKAEVMSADEIEAIRKRSRAGNSGPWITDWNEMAKKTVFRRLSKWLPLSPEFRDAVEADEEPAAPIEVRQAKVVAPVDDDVPFSFGGVPGPVPEDSATQEPQQSEPAPSAEAEKPQPTAQPAKQADAPAPASDALSPAEKLVQLAAQAGVPFEAVEAWAKARHLNASKDSDAAKIIRAWSTVEQTLKLQGGAK